VFNTARGLLAAAGKTSRTRLHFLTRNAQPIAEGDRANPGHAVLWGLGRTLALEQPDVWGAVIDVDASVPPELAARYVTAEVYDTGGEDQVVYRAGVRYVPRLHRTTAPSATDAGFQGSQLVIGATGNIGPHLINRLAEEGAGTIVAVSRNPGSRLDELAETLAARGVSLVTVAADVSDETAMSALFDRFGADLPPLDGLYLAAFGGAPATLDDMTDADVAAMFGPKLDAVSLLHRLSLRTPIRRFVLFSSISGLVGSRWLAHYAATTTFLDTFAYARRAAGLPATSINWGWWKSLADSQSDQERRVTLDSGLRPMPDGQAIAALGPVSAPGGPVRCAVVAADWTRLATAYRTRAALRIVDDLLPGDGADDAGTGEAAGGATLFRERLRGTEPAHRRDLLTAHVSGLVAALLGLASPQAFDPATGFFQLGMDSLMSVTLQRTLSEHLGEVLPASVVFDYPTVHALSGYLATVLPELADGTADPDVADAQDDHLYDELTEDELLRELSERLN
jgi:phthiocerol/phenolphthiocerol synthesis type-I polyketide synthase B